MRKYNELTQSNVEKHEIDNNFRASFYHVVADAFVSFLVIIAIILAGNVKVLYWADPIAGIIGAGVIISWAYQLILDSGANLLDMCPDPLVSKKLSALLERDGSRVMDMHIWRLGPGHLGAIISMLPPQTPAATANPRGYNAAYYHSRMSGFRAISHATIEVQN